MVMIKYNFIKPFIDIILMSSGVTVRRFTHSYLDEAATLTVKGFTKFNQLWKSEKFGDDLL